MRPSRSAGDALPSGGLATHPALVAEIARLEHFVGGREHGAVSVIEAPGGAPVAQRDQFRAFATEYRLRHPPVLRPLVVAAGHPTDAQDHELAQAMVERGVEEKGVEKIRDRLGGLRATEQRPEDVELRDRIVKTELFGDREGRRLREHRHAFVGHLPPSA